MTVSLDEQLDITMNTRVSTSGTRKWMFDGTTDSTSEVIEDPSGVFTLSISKASKSVAGIHHFYYHNNERKGGLTRVIVRGKELINEKKVHEKTHPFTNINPFPN